MIKGMIELDLEVKHKTNNAFLVSDGDNDFWLPISQIDWEEPAEIGDITTFYISQWLAEEKGLV
jgi:hypothetical protein